jgi:uncharacterized protein (TIGR00290 family)
MDPLFQSNFFMSWSGGKDSALSLFKAINRGGKPVCLLTMLTEEGVRSRGHGLSRAVLEAQSKAMQIPIHFFSATWDHYETVFLNALKAIALRGVSHGVFGDLPLPEKPDWIAHREWAEKVCCGAGMIAVEPLWKSTREELTEEFYKSGFEAKIIAIKEGVVEQNYLGQNLTRDLMRRLEDEGIDGFGERGEYHTVTVAGPIFKKPLLLKENGCLSRDGYCFLDVAIK